MSLRALGIHAQSFEDVQKLRIMVENRIRAFGEEQGVEQEAMQEDLEALAALEHTFGLSMRRAYRRAVTPEIRTWQQGTVGMGEHLIARLIAEIGEPAVAYPSHWEDNPDFNDSLPAGRENEKRLLIEDEPYERTLRQLWSYCGVGDPARKRTKGMGQDDALGLGNPRAKTVMHLLAVACVKLRQSPYRAVYDTARVEYASRVDEAGKPWSAGHQHNAALRLMKKAILRDLFNVSLAAQEAVAA